jgi:hypothetical protein
MAHSHSRHKRDSAGHRRAKQFLHENRGGACKPVVKKHGGAIGHRAPADYDEPDIKAEGHKGRHRFKAGGKVRHQTNIVVIGHHPQPPMGAGPAPGGAPMAGAPPMPPPGVIPPQGPAAGLMAPGTAPGQPLPMRKAGGRIHNSFEHPTEDISDYREAHPHMNQGGSLSGSYGSASGMSRKAEFEKLKRKG